jgi:hypothetical protein
MSTTALLRRNALSSVKRLTSSEPLLSFLYNTRTIRREHTDALSEFENTFEQQKPKSRSRDNDSGNRPSFRPRRDRYENEGRPRRFEGTRSRRDDSEDVEDGSDNFSERPRIQHRRPVREEHIPFEHAAQETMSIRDKIVTSTMTPHEKKAFEGLLSLSQQKTPKDKSRHRDRIEEVLKQASKSRATREALDVAPMPEALRKMQDKMNEDRSAAQKVLLEQAIELDLQQVKKAFATAETDVELWKMMHEKVLSRVTRLRLDEPAPQQPTRKPRRKSKSETDTEQVSQWPGNISDEQVITRTLPQHLVECERQLFFDFPSSQLSVSLLPYLKSLGPTTFALAASTKLYNRHMRSLFKSQSNLPQVVHTLEEMDKEVYEFDDKTRDLVESIRKRGALARRMIFGGGMSALWGGERFRKASRAATYWAHKIDGRMQEQALKEARAKEDDVAL